MEKSILNKKTSKPSIQINYNLKNNQADKSNNINKNDIHKTKRTTKRKFNTTNNNTCVSQTTGNADPNSQINIDIKSILPKPAYLKSKNNIIRGNTNENKKNNLSNENKILKSEIKHLNEDMDNLKKNLKNKEKEINELNNTLLNKDKEIEELNNTLLNKDKEIEELKASLNNKEGQGKKILKESIKLIFEQENVKDSIKPWDNINESINRIIDNYLIENENLKKKVKESEETINYLKERLVSAKKEIIDKEQNIFQIKNENINQIEDLTIKYEQKLFEINYNYKFLKDLYDEAKEENKKLRNNIIDKDEENTNLLIENEDNKNKLKKIEELNKDKNQINENLRNSRRDFNKEKELLETNYKLLQNEYNDLKDEYNKILNNSNKNYSNNNIEIMKKLKDLEK
jgi:chromosome segregation ATPase